MRFVALFVGFAAALLASLPQAHADSLPDLKGQKVVVGDRGYLSAAAIRGPRERQGDGLGI